MAAKVRGGNKQYRPDAPHGEERAQYVAERARRVLRSGAERFEDLIASTTPRVMPSSPGRIPTTGTINRVRATSPRAHGTVRYAGGARVERGTQRTAVVPTAPSSWTTFASNNTRAPARPSSSTSTVRPSPSIANVAATQSHAASLAGSPASQPLRRPVVTTRAAIVAPSMITAQPPTRPIASSVSQADTRAPSTVIAAALPGGRSASRASSRAPSTTRSVAFFAPSLPSHPPTRGSSTARSNAGIYVDPAHALSERQRLETLANHYAACDDEKRAAYFAEHPERIEADGPLRDAFAREFVELARNPSGPAATRRLLDHKEYQWLLDTAVNARNLASGTVPERNSFCAAVPTQKVFLEYARKSLIAEICKVVKPPAPRMEEYIKKYPHREWMVKAAVGARKAVPKVGADKIRVYCEANPEESDIVQFALTSWKNALDKRGESEVAANETTTSSQTSGPPTAAPAVKVQESTGIPARTRSAASIPQLSASTTSAPSQAVSPSAAPPMVAPHQVAATGPSTSRFAAASRFVAQVANSPAVRQAATSTTGIVMSSSTPASTRSVMAEPHTPAAPSAVTRMSLRPPPKPETRIAATDAVAEQTSSNTPTKGVAQSNMDYPTSSPASGTSSISSGKLVVNFFDDHDELLRRHRVDIGVPVDLQIIANSLVPGCSPALLAASFEALAASLRVMSTGTNANGTGMGVGTRGLTDVTRGVDGPWGKE